ncbi:hypothetical protein BDM02DRAFT_150841 [Thelephora ganbajun]|uniref:Uncharacterized protein n=1 Tax=Thelephora ganbajun TaxID=370292 RepID=A0ACB6ZZL2_THEGA|nr:hypothetical protein BDM02DRAFT_150841 [Thelephora ganbajun]
MLPELERLINAFDSSPLLTRRPRIAYGSSNVHDANDPASACGIDGLHKFSVFPLATPTRTSLASFEPLLPLLTCLCLLPFILPFYDLHHYPRLPWLVPESSRTVVLGRRADNLYCGRFREKRFCVVFPQWLRNEFLPRLRRYLNGGNSSLLGFCPWVGPCVFTSLIVQTCITESPRVVCYVNVAVDLLAFCSLVPYPLSTLPASVLLSAFSFPVAISFSLSRLQSHVGYGGHDILALYAKLP